MKFRKSVIGLAMVCALTTASVTPALASGIMINNKQLVTSVEPYVKYSTTMVPLRAIAENLKCNVTYIAESKTIVIKKSDTRLQLTIGSQRAFINGEQVIVSIAPEIKNGSTMVPLRFIAQTFACDVGYDAKTKTVTITGNDLESSAIVNNTKGTYNNSTEKYTYTGEKTRTTNLPEHASYFPYISEETPNWCYENIFKAMNSRAWGVNLNPNKPNTPAAYDTPVEWSDSVGIPGLAIGGEEFWNTITNPKASPKGTNRELINYLVYKLINYDYTNLGTETVKKSNLAFLFKNFFHPKTSTLKTADSAAAQAGGYIEEVIENKVKTSGEFDVIEEGVWSDYSCTACTVHIPVYVKMTIDHFEANGKYFGMPGFSTSGMNSPQLKEIQQGDIFEGVYWITMVYTSDKLWKISLLDFDLSCQLEHNLNYYNGVEPKRVTIPSDATFSYYWMKEGTYKPLKEINSASQATLTSWSKYK